ncbi:hypothetical protein, partial [Motilibacter deserti]|uniref:hypothetical protein n=1 Tax=Motilibacter deserti TaxID=2714956 RepID=UPI001E375D3E
NERVTRSRALVAKGYKPAVVARVAKVSRQSLHRRRERRTVTAGPGAGRPGDEAIVEVAKANPVDGTRMIAALASRELGEPVNRKRVARNVAGERHVRRLTGGRPRSARAGRWEGARVQAVRGP